MCPICKLRESWSGDRDGRCRHCSNAPGGYHRADAGMERLLSPREAREFKAWRQRVLDNTLPMLQNSPVAIALVPRTEADIKMAVELGLMVLLDKPIIAVVEPGTQVPAKLVAVADRIIEAPLRDATDRDSEVADRIKAAITELTVERGDG